MAVKLITAETVAEILGVKVQTLAAWRCRRTVDLPFVKIGGHVMYRESDVEEFINANVRGADNAVNR